MAVVAKVVVGKVVAMCTILYVSLSFTSIRGCLVVFSLKYCLC